MKKLTTMDLFAAMRLVKVTGARERLKNIAKQASEGKRDLTDIGIDTVLELMEGLAEAGAEMAFYEFLANPFEMTDEEVAELSVTELVDKLKLMAKENDLKGFFYSLSGRTDGSSPT